MNSKHRTRKPAPPSDFSTMNCGSVAILYAHTDAARSWAEDHLDNPMTWGQNGYVIEPRYMGPILDGIRDAGFTLGG